MNKYEGLLKGQKTYVAAGLGIAAAILAYLTGEMAGQKTLELCFEAILTILLRRGMTRETEIGVEKTTEQTAEKVKDIVSDVTLPPSTPDTKFK